MPSLGVTGQLWQGGGGGGTAGEGGVPQPGAGGGVPAVRAGQLQQAGGHHSGAGHAATGKDALFTLGMGGVEGQTDFPYVRNETGHLSTSWPFCVRVQEVFMQLLKKIYKRQK